jgi:hypothetical protein
MGVIRVSLTYRPVADSVNAISSVDSALSLIVVPPDSYSLSKSSATQLGLTKPDSYSYNVSSRPSILFTTTVSATMSIADD